MKCWQRDWDGQWRMILFDLPKGDKPLRIRLWRWLRLHRFGCLQQSVWICPDPVTEIIAHLKARHDNVESFVVMEAQPITGFSNESIVNAAWDFKVINSLYRRCMSLGTSCLERMRSHPVLSVDLIKRLQEEDACWRRALARDPVLPKSLAPAVYLGQEAWEIHRNVLLTMSGFSQVRPLQK